uniref:Uncharacterized protein n=1 Tax=Ananas comosus var. bracteatus TaxID=296719 RepID=A0A6V7P1E5_ANACO|nr:unnamed protein product [Ananas comosus var. bracteatus]
MSATPESGFVLSRWCRSCQLDLLSTDQLVWIELDSRNGARTGVFTVPGTGARRCQGGLEYIYTRAVSSRGFYRVIQAVPDCRVPLRACLSSTEIRCILSWVASTSAIPESGFVLSRWCRSCQLDLLSTDQLVWIELDSRNGAGMGVFTVPGRPQVPAAAPSVDQDRGKGVAS